VLSDGGAFVMAAHAPAPFFMLEHAIACFFAASFALLIVGFRHSLLASPPLLPL